jgi:hypothetical protein
MYETTWYFREKVWPKRPFIKLEWCIAIIEAPLHEERQRTAESDSGAEFQNSVTEFSELLHWKTEGQS